MAESNKNKTSAEDFGFVPDEINTEQSQSEDLGFVPDVETPSFSDTQSVSEDTSPQDLKIPVSESMLKGALQGVTLGFADEIAAGWNSAPKILEGLESLQKEYQILRDIEREKYKKAQEANPAAYTGAEVAAGVATAFVPGLNMAKAAKAAYSAPGALKALATIGKGAASGAGTGAVSAAGYSEAEDVAGMAKDVGEGALVGGAMGAAIPVGISTVKGVKKGLTKSAELVPITEDALDAFKLGLKGEKVYGKDIIKSINKQLDDQTELLSKQLKLAKKGGSDKINQALVSNEAKLVSGERFISDLENTIDTLKTETGEAATKQLEDLTKKLDKFKKLKTTYKVQQLGELPSSADEAASKLTSKIREQEISSKMLGEEFSSTPVTTTPEGDYVTSLLKTRTPVSKQYPHGESVVKPLMQKIEGNLGKRTGIDIVPDKIKDLTPSEVYDLRKSISEMMQNTDDKEAISKLSGLLKKVDQAIDESVLTPSNKKLLEEGKSIYSETSDMLKSIKPLEEAGSQFDDFSKTLSRSEARKKLSGMSETSENLRDAFKEHGDKYGILPTMEKLQDATRRKELAMSADNKSAVSLGGAIGTLQALAIKGGNLAGQGVKKIQPVIKGLNVAGGITATTAGTSAIREGSKPDQSPLKTSLDYTPEQIVDFSNKIKNIKGGEQYSSVLEQAAQQSERSRKSILFGLLQQPAFRELMKKVENE